MTSDWGKSTHMVTLLAAPVAGPKEAKFFFHKSPFQQERDHTLLWLLLLKMETSTFSQAVNLLRMLFREDQDRIIIKPFKTRNFRS